MVYVAGANDVEIVQLSTRRNRDRAQLSSPVEQTITTTGCSNDSATETSALDTDRRHDDRENRSPDAPISLQRYKYKSSWCEARMPAADANVDLISHRETAHLT